MIVVISCGSAKLTKAAPARDLYVGSWFRAQLDYARSIAADDDIRILSALHGLIGLDEKLEPYNVRMGDRGSITTTRLYKQAQSLGDQDVLCIAGSDYAKRLTAVHPSARWLWDVVGDEIPRRGMGRMISWLVRNKGRHV